MLKPIYEYAKKNDPNLNLSYKKWISQKTIIKYESGTDVLVVSYKDQNKELLLSTLTKIKNTYQEYSLSDRKKTLSQSINYLAELIGGITTYIPKRPGEPDITHADISKAQRLLGYSPQISFEKGVEIVLENIEYWRDAPVWTPETIVNETKEWFKHLT